MPLIVISGLPASGKSTRAQELQHFFNTKGKQTLLISENVAIPKAGFQKNAYYADSQKEKVVRSDLKSEVLRELGKQHVVILDAGNYIKGYRYELFCATKAARSTQCTLFCGIQAELAWEFNLRRTNGEDNLLEIKTKLNNSDVPYTRDIFDALCMRFEEPHGNSRWDSPLFVVFPNDAFDMEAIYQALYETKALPPNLSTQNPPQSDTNYVHELDRLTRQVIDDVLAARKIGILGPTRITGSQVKLAIPLHINATQLNRLRRQFLNYIKTHHTTTGSLEKVQQLFVIFLNSNCTED